MSSSESVCRACLGDVSSNSHSLQNIQLKEIYETFTCTKVSIEDRMPRGICSICYSRLQSFHKFSDAALKSEIILRELLTRGIEEVTLNTITKLNLGLKRDFSMTTAQCLSIDDTNTECNDNPLSLPTFSNRQVFNVFVYDTSGTIKLEVNVKQETVSDDEDYQMVKTENREDGCEIDNNLKTKHSPIEGETSNAEVSHFSCNVCSKQFTTIHLLKSHLICHSGEKLFICEKCNKSFGRKQNLVQHMNTCTPIEQSQMKSETNPDDIGLYFYCEVCSKRFTKKHLLKSHLITHSGEKPHSCEGCKKSFSRKQSMKEHMKICAKVKPGTPMFPCSFCSQTFTSESYRSNHVTKKHSIEKPYTCEKCHKAFSRKPNMKQHMKICFLENEMVNCTLCIKTFTSKSDLSKHLNVDHIEEKPYACERCSTKYWHKRDLKVHMRTHTGEKPFSCETCGKIFSFRNHLKVHIRIHTGEKPYICELCSKKFSTLFGFREHIRFHSGDKPYECKICGKIFGYRGTLRQHLLKVHTAAKPFFCNICSFSFTEESSLTAHMKVHTAARPYACDVCNKTFTEARHLKGHKQVHSEERPHACEACGNAYKRREGLKQHMKSKCKAIVVKDCLTNINIKV